MVTIVVPNQANKPGAVEIRVDDVHMGTVCGTVTDIDLEPAVNQFMVVVETDHVSHYLWADAIRQAKQ